MWVGLCPTYQPHPKNQPQNSTTPIPQPQNANPQTSTPKCHVRSLLIYGQIILVNEINYGYLHVKSGLNTLGVTLRSYTGSNTCWSLFRVLLGSVDDLNLNNNSILLGLPAGFLEDLKMVVLAWRRRWRFVPTYIEEWRCEEPKYLACWRMKIINCHISVY